jgi:S1-C subfamily serine protease
MRARFVGLLALAACGGPQHAPHAAVPHAPLATPPAAVAPRPLSPADIAQRALPAIVTIRTEHSLGTGFVLRKDGWIATNLHVIVDGPPVKVTLHGEREVDVVEVLAASVQHDLALVRVQAQDLPVVSLGDSDAMRAGDAVVAIGNPMGLENTVSNGLVSARRQVDHDTEVLQISAPIAPGSSGGPIFNDRGEVIGVATAVLLQGQNLNFGMPARYLTPLLKDPKPVSLADFVKTLAKTLGQPPQAATKVHRNQLSYPLATLEGCTVDAQKFVFDLLGRAIKTGAPLFNSGDHEGCYHLYDGTASEVVRKLPAACKGPARVLAQAQKRAASLSDSVSQAWVMRDAFDAMLDVIVRKQRP